MSSVEIDRQWTTRLRKRVEGKLPPEKVLPDTQPSYVSSWIYVFGVATLTSFVLVLLTGCVLALRGPQWWHESNYGHFVNSLHLWSVEIFFFSMVIHLWGKYFMAAWRGGRQLTWMTGGITFLVSIAAGFTGYVSQSNFDSQWISTQAKDGINATGAGAYFNVLNLGQMLMWHIVLLPLVAVLLTTVHVVMVRIKGVVPPFADDKKVA
ncbi:MAG: cytochrome b N-terminal domain-containing protein [Acidimicrobiaceae bacterium]|jgi:ubiquinol-cytochrome c reductase cytochrome b subunit